MASAIASLPEAHAETGVCTPALAPMSRPMFAAGALGISIGIVSGETRRGPLSWSDVVVASSVCTPPMPEAMATPRPLGVDPAVGEAGVGPGLQAAMRANCAERSSRRALTRSRTSVGSTATSAAICDRAVWAQSWVRGLTPERPSSRASQVVATSPPTGVVAAETGDDDSRSLA